MKEFKVGDVVRTLKERDPDGCRVFPVGTIGVISKIMTDFGKDLPYKVEADGDFWWYSADMFELCNPVSDGDEIRKITLDEAKRISKMVSKSCNTCPFEDNGCSAIRCLKSPQAILEDFNERYDDLVKVLKTLKERLDKGEKEYLTAVLKPYKRFENTLFVVKHERLWRDNKEYLVIKAEDGNGDYDLDFVFPDFKKGTKYAGLEPNKKYSLKELGLTL